MSANRVGLASVCQRRVRGEWHLPKRFCPRTGHLDHKSRYT